MNQKPAVILITCDELRRDVLGCYGGKAVDTPNIDSLMDRGIRYDNCYTVSPLCLPARCSILTGQYPHRSGAYSNFRKCALDQGIPNLFTEMRKMGYETSLFGKCHFAPVPYDEVKPDRTLPYEEFRDYYVSLGIDHLELQDDKQVSVWFSDDYSKQLDEAGYLAAYRADTWNNEKARVFPFPGPAEWHPDVWVGDRAAEYFSERTAEDKPLFAWVSFSGPHYPFDAPAGYYSRVREEELPVRRLREGEFADESRIHHGSYYGGGHIDGCGTAPERGCKNYTDEYWKRLQISYHANMALIDDEVGKILAAVRKAYGDDALIIFTADHGEMLGNHGMWGKHDCAYDDVWHIPFLMRLPGQENAAVENGMINLNDILPTCLKAAEGEGTVEDNAAGGDSPDGTIGKNGAAESGVFAAYDGTALQDRLEGKADYLEYTFAESEGFCAVTDGTYKYIHVQKPGHNHREFLDMSSDPFEFENKIDDPALAAEQARLMERMLTHFMPEVLP